MFKRITTKEDFIQDPILEMNAYDIENASTDEVVLFGKKYRMYSDEWKHHVHIKCTDRCDANCSFCIEKSERNNPQNENNMISSTRKVLMQLAVQGHLKTVSITGGEPTVFREIKRLIDFIGTFDLKLFSINTNGRYLSRIPKNFNGWVDISKHAIDDTDVFNRTYNIDISKIALFKEGHPNASVRFQCVLGVSDKMKTIEDIIEYIIMYRNWVDDFSFRNLIIENNESKINDLLLKFRNLMLDSGKLVEQVIQDYYVYETYKFLGTTVTLSWSNMKELREYNETHSSNFLEEIIIHPDGMVTGSWNKKSLIIYNPKDKSQDSFIECKGIGCEHPCKRYSKKKERSYVNDCYTNDYRINSCDTVVDSCYSVSNC